MKRILFCLLAVTLTAGFAFAQQFKIEKSQPFDEPDYGWNKLLQLKGGNTFLFHAQSKEGIDVTVYDKSRKQISKKMITSKKWDEDKLKTAKILGLHEINGQPVLFLCIADEKVPKLFRIRFDPNTGAVAKEEMLGALPKVTMKQGYAIVFGNLDVSDIIVERDPNSDCYAVIFFNTVAHSRNERIHVLHFDGNHKLLNEAYYESPNNTYKYLRYVASAVDGDKNLYITTYAYNGRKGGDEDPKMIVSKLTAGDSSFKHNMLAFTEDYSGDTKSAMNYNNGNNMLQLLIVTKTGGKSSFFSGTSKSIYSVQLVQIDPRTLTISSVKPIVNKMVRDYAHAHIDKDYDFVGIPQHMLINKDNTMTILSEEITTETHYSSRGQVTAQKTDLGPIGVSEFNIDGAEAAGYAISKQQQMDGIMPTLYLRDRSKGIFTPAVRFGFGGRRNSNQFMSFDYINAASGRYVVFNDLPVNVEKDEDEQKRKMVTSVSGTNTMCYKLNNGSVEKFFLFGQPESKTSAFSYVEVSDFNKETSCYATLMVEREGRDKQARVAWVTFE